ncbi:ETS-related transcription factor Elf-4-like isoform X2 [Xenia sp. Carnegie-2017]|nr:ETS-related transcription factor Elf-4-like isoform X2 [Xenia sp. Carnegie-2017]XP_046863635.1 ETS-related transcription factor Elf-4-like isoform X2 [Xenia sp. Carnegie-2017]
MSNGIGASPSAPPLVATTVTMDTIQDLMQSQTSSLEYDDPCTGPFQDTRFDQVVQVQSTADRLISEEDEISIFNIPGIEAVSNIEPPSLSIDINYDSGIEEEIEEHKKKPSGKRGKTNLRRLDKLPAVTVTVDNADESEEDTVSKFQCQYLWEFLQSLLNCKKFNSKYIEWKNHPEGIFKLNDHHSVARLWGIQKKRKNMTYDKLSRALRYYYSKNILQKVTGERLTYKFCKSVYEYKSS